MSFSYCQFNSKGYCLKCKWQVKDYDPSITTIRECRPEATDMPLIRTKDGNPSFLKNHFENQSVFLIGGGPSINTVDTSFLSSRGILSFAINNIGAYKSIRPNFWLCTDETSQFHEVIWKDGQIWKFIPEHFSGKPFKLADGSWSKYCKRLCPNTWTFTLNEKFNSKEFFTTDNVCFGASKDFKDDLGLAGGRSTMLAAFKILFYLGFKKIFLLGVDFKMKEEEPYAFPQKKHKAGCNTNNGSYKLLEKRLTALKPQMKNFGMEVYNCNLESHLKCFPFLPVWEAIDLALKDFYTDDPKLENMYG